MRIKKFGIRAKLTLLAIAIVSLLYLLLGVTVFVVARSAILGSIDSGLGKMAEGFDRQNRRPPPRPPDDDLHDHDGFEHHHGEHFGGPDGPGGPGLFDPGPDDHRGPGQGHDLDQNQASSPRNPPRQATVDIHDGRPRVVWMDHDAQFPFPQSPPLDAATVPLARQGIRTLRTVKFDEEPIRVLTIPVYRFGSKEVEGVVELTYWMGDIDKVLNTLAGTLFLILPLGILLMGSASLYVVGKTLRPVREITTAAARIEAEDLSGRLPVTGNDEFGELAETMNGMLGRLDKAFARQRETLDQLREVILQQRRFTADASHELKTPLAVVKVSASLLKSSVSKDPDALESLGAIDDAVNRMSKLVQDLLLLARTDSGQLGDQFEPVDASSIANRAANLVPCGDKIRILRPEEPVWVLGSSFALERLIINLLDNACRHTDEGGTVTLAVESTPDCVLIAVTDDGEGIPEDHLPKIFERFHRVDSSRHSGTGGTGLGLAIGKGIVEAHRGTIEVTSREGHGATFTVRLPPLKA